MFHFAIIIDSDDLVGRGTSCQLFNNSCKVEMLDSEYSVLTRSSLIR
jgi:hypothetical protein